MLSDHATYPNQFQTSYIQDMYQKRNCTSEKVAFISNYIDRNRSHEMDQVRTDEMSRNIHNETNSFSYQNVKSIPTWSSKVFEENKCNLNCLHQDSIPIQKTLRNRATLIVLPADATIPDGEDEPKLKSLEEWKNVVKSHIKEAGLPNTKESKIGILLPRRHKTSKLDETTGKLLQLDWEMNVSLALNGHKEKTRRFKDIKCLRKDKAVDQIDFKIIDIFGEAIGNTFKLNKNHILNSLEDFDPNLIIMANSYVHFYEIYQLIKETCKNVIHPSFIDDQAAIILSTNKVSGLKLRDYLKSNIDKLRLENKDSTQIAIFGAHGGENGSCSRLSDFWQHYFLLEEHEWTRDGKTVHYDGFKNDIETNKMIFQPIDVFEGQTYDRSEDDFDEQYLISKLNELKEPRLKKPFKPQFLFMFNCSGYMNTVKEQIQKISGVKERNMFILPKPHNSTLLDYYRKYGTDISNIIKKKIRKYAENNPATTDQIQIAILGCQGPKEIDDGRDAHFLKKFWRIMYGFEYEENGKVVTIKGLKSNAFTRDIRFEPIDIFHGRLRKGFDDEYLKRRLKELEDPKLQRPFIPNLIVMAMCWSQFNIVSRTLRRSGLFSEIIARGELIKISGIKDARLSKEQLEVFREFARPKAKCFGRKTFSDLFIWGASGSGKTLIGVLRVKQMIDEWKDNSNSDNIRVYLSNSNFCWFKKTDKNCSADYKLLAELENEYFGGYRKCNKAGIPLINTLSSAQSILQHFPGKFLKFFQNRKTIF